MEKNVRTDDRSHDQIVLDGHGPAPAEGYVHSGPAPIPPWAGVPEAGEATRTTATQRRALGLEGWAVLVELAWLMALAPVVLLSRGLGPVALAVAIVGWAGWRWRREFPVPRTSLNLPLLMFFLALPMSFWQVREPDLAVPRVGSLVLGAMLYFTMAGSLGTERRLRLAAKAFSLAGGAIALGFLVSVEWPTLAGLPLLVTLVPGTTRGGINPNEAGAVLAFFLPVALAVAVGSAREPRGRLRQVVAFLGTALLLAGMLLLTQSRSAILAAVVGVALTMVWPWRRLRLAVLALSLVVAGGLTAMYLVPATRHQVRDLVVGAIVRPHGVSWLGVEVVVWPGPASSRPAEYKDVTLSLAARLEMWGRGLEMLGRAPWTGVGPGQFASVHQRDYPPLPAFFDLSVPHVHNLFLQVAVEYGLIGWVGAVVLFGSFIVLSLRVAGAASSPFVRWMGLGLAGAAVCYLTFGLGDAVVFGARGSLVLWPAMALAAAGRRLEGLHRAASDQMVAAGYAIAGRRVPGSTVAVVGWLLAVTAAAIMVGWKGADLGQTLRGIASHLAG